MCTTLAQWQHEISLGKAPSCTIVRCSSTLKAVISIQIIFCLCNIASLPPQRKVRTHRKAIVANVKAKTISAWWS
eukprot:1342498-Amphidinium_carterae.2